MIPFMKTSKSYESESPSEKGSAEKASFPSRDKIFAAIFYGVTSFGVIFTNKSVMTNYDFPFFDFLAFIQFTFTTIVLSTLALCKKIEIPFASWAILKEVLPISAMFLGNVICGLGGTRSLNLPMFTALRRFSILMTMLAEMLILGNHPSSPIVVSVVMMVGGAFLAAVYDLKFDTVGYILVFLNNCFTTLNGVWMKKASMSGRCSKIAILFYNSLFSAVVMFFFFIGEHLYIANHNNEILFAQTAKVAPTSVSMSMSSKIEVASAPVAAGLALVVDAIKHRFLTAVGTEGAATTESLPALMESTVTGVLSFTKWHQWDFLAFFIVAATMGSILNYSIFLCTTLNSALTTAVIGCLKNVATTYIGMIIFSDYAFEIVNFIGLNISIMGSLYYTYVTMFKGLSGFGSG